MPDWSVTDATGTEKAYDVTVRASEPTINGQPAGSLATVTLGCPGAPANAEGVTDGPALVGSGPLSLSAAAATLASAAPGAGMGEWTFSHGANNTALSVVIPADAPAGA